MAVITDLEAEVIHGKVLIDGTVHKQIFFVGPYDVVRHQAVDIPFTAFVEVPNAEPGMTAQIHPTIEHVGWVLIRETPECPMPEYYEPIYDHCYRVVDQRIVIELFVKVTEFVQVHVCLREPPPPPPPPPDNC